MSPVLRRHITLPHTTRRLGRRSYHTLLPSAAEEASADTRATAPPNAVDGGSSNADGNWELTSPPEILGTRAGFGVGDNSKLGLLDPGFTGVFVEDEEGGGGAGVGEGIRGCAEWAMSFSGDLKQGMTTVKVRGEGLEFCNVFFFVEGVT